MPRRAGLVAPSARSAVHAKEAAAALAGRPLAPLVGLADAGALPLKSASVQLVVTSPPYPLVAMWDGLFERATGLSAEDERFFAACHDVLERAWAECARVLAPGGIVAVNVGDATRTVGGSFRCFPNHAEVTSRAVALGLHPLVPILWKKPTNKPNAFLGSGFVPSNGYVTLDCEHVLLFRKGGPRRFPPHDVLRYASAFTKEERDVWFSQVWDLRGARQDGAYRRTAAFPDALPQRLVRMFSILGDTVLDPFAGTGTTVHVARRLGRRALGFELDRGLLPVLRDLPRSAPSVDEVLAART